MSDQKFCPVQWSVAKLNSLQPVLLLLLRFYIGYQSMVAGLGHLQNVDKTADYFKSLNIPMPRLNVYIAGSVEYFGGELLMFGLLSRLVAIPFTINFIVAILAANLADPKYRQLLFHILDSQDVVLKDDAFPFFFVGLMVLIFGPGKFSLDEIFVKPLFRRKVH